VPSLTNITPPRVPLLDPNTNTITREWYRFFLSLFQTVQGSSGSSSTDFTVAPSTTLDTELGVEFDALANAPQPSLGEVQQQIDILRQEVETLPQIETDALVSFFGPAVLSKLTVEGITVGRGAGAVSNNTAVGTTALASNSTGDENTAFGYAALYNNNTGARNTAVGSQALVNNTNGNDNTAVGRNAMISNNTGYQNVGLGYQPLYANQSGSDNIGIGYRSLFSSVSASQSVAVGTRALTSATAGSNTAIGFEALNANTSGVNNVAIGHSALINVSTGSGNFGAAFKDSAGNYLPVSDPTTANNQIVMGHQSVTDAFVRVAWTVTSDARDKTNFARVPHGLAFVNNLRPVAFQFRTSRDSEETNGRVRYGFRAQDILKLEGDSPVIINDDDPDHLKYNGESLVPVLVNAIQEQQVLIEELWASVGKLYERIK